MSRLYKEKGLFVGCVEFYVNDVSNNVGGSGSVGGMGGINGVGVYSNNRRYMRYPFKVNNY